MNLNPYRFVPGDTLGIELSVEQQQQLERYETQGGGPRPTGNVYKLPLKDRPMTPNLAELATNIQADCMASDDKQIRKHGSNYRRCVRMARRRLDNPNLTRKALAARSVSDEASFLSVLLSFIQKLLPWLQLVMVFMADSATTHAEAYGMRFPDEQTPAPASKEVIHSPPNDVVKDRNPTTEPGFGFKVSDDPDWHLPQAKPFE